MELTDDYWRRQRFARVEPSVVRIAVDLVGLYGTAPTCYLSSVARVAGFERAQLDRALYESRDLIRVRAMRGSLYMVPRDRLGVVMGATRRSLAGLGSVIGKAIPPPEQAKLVRHIERLLANEPLAAAEIRKRVDPKHPAVAECLKYLIARMATEGRIVRALVTGGWRSDRFVYALWEDWVGSPLELVDETEARVALARWYLEAFGPATVDDFSWWSGLTKTAGRDAMLAADPLEVETAQGTLLAATAPATGPPAAGVRLLPVWETALIGHVDRTRIVPAEWRAWAYDASGNATSTVLVDGSVAGLWQLEGRDELVARVAPLAGFDRATWEAVDGELETIAAALGVRAGGVVRCELPGPLVEAPRNRFLSPLRDC